VCSIDWTAKLIVIIGFTIAITVGTFSEMQATEYCLTVKDMALPSSPYSEENMQ